MGFMGLAWRWRLEGKQETREISTAGIRHWKTDPKSSCVACLLLCISFNSTCSLSFFAVVVISFTLYLLQLYQLASVDAYLAYHHFARLCILSQTRTKPHLLSSSPCLLSLISSFGVTKKSPELPLSS